MAQEIINNGTFDNDPSAEKIRISFDKTNSNFTELYAGLGLGGSVLSIDQPISMIGATQSDSETKQVSDAIAARSNDFTIPVGSIPLVSSYLPYISGDSETAYVHKKTYILNTGEGTYGATGSITLDVSNVIKLNEEIVKPSTIIDLGDIGVTAISTAVNNANPSNTKLGLTLVTAIQSGVIQNYIFDAVDGDYGSADLQTSSDNFIDLNTEPNLSRNVNEDSREPLTRSIDVTIAYEDLDRTNVFTQSNAVITVDSDVNLFIENGSNFLVYFTGGGTHTISALSSAAIQSFSQYDLVYVQKNDTNNWIVSKLGDVSTPVVALENVVHINSADDFPAAVSGVRELVQGTNNEVTYLIAAKDIDMGSDVFTITGGEVVIRGAHRTASGIVTTSTDPMFTCEDSSFFQELIAFDCGGKWVEFTNPSLGTNAFANQNVIIRSCGSLGTIDGAFVTSLRTMTVIDTTTGGFTWTGITGSQINMSDFLGISWAGTLFDLGTATFDIIDIGAGNRFLSPSGTTILSGLASSGNLTATGVGLVDNNIFNGLGTSLSGIDPLDLQWSFNSNIFTDGTKNTESVVGTFLTATETVTIGSSGVYVAIGGTDWDNDIAKRFTVSTAGLITYIGLEAIDVVCSAVATVSKVGGGSDIICSKIAINGTVSDKTISCTENTQPTSIASQGLFELETGDTIQLFVANEDSTSNIVVDTANIIISKRN